MRSFRASRDLYAIGSNPDAAALAGIPIGRRVFTAFLISGALAGLAGALFLALHTQIDNSGGLGYELSVVAAVVVGGVAIFGGSGTVVGAALGALLLNTINQALVASRISAFWNQADRRRAAARRHRLRPLADACASPGSCSRPRERTVSSDVA